VCNPFEGCGELPKDRWSRLSTHPSKDFIMKKQQLLSLALGSAFAVAAISPAMAANPFEASKLDSGYQLAQADMKQKDGKCGEAKCGADKKKEASCGADKKKDASCGAKK
jgi:uncharacterized low-complexity protein